jgi:hypothetical protein
VLVAAFGGKLDQTQRRVLRAVAGRRKPPAQRVAELWIVAGRRSGKSRIAAAIATFIGVFVDNKHKLVAGEAGYILVLAPSRPQAALVFQYVQAFLRSSPMLATLIENETADEIKLKGNIVIAVHANSFRTVRGRTLLACIFDETAFWQDETTANPDIETYRAVLPALATTGGMLIGISSPYRKAGLLYQKFHDHFGKTDDDVLVVRGPSLQFNPTIDRTVIARARRSDPTAAASEWDAEFRDDISGFIDLETIEAAVERDVRERAPERGQLYLGFFDAAGGSAGGDSMTMAVAHAADDKLVLDAVIERKPPFSPEEVAAEFAAMFRRYRVSVAQGDKWGGTWPAEALRRHGIAYRPADRTRSEIYLDLLPELNSGRVLLLDNPRLLTQLAALERRATRAGRDAIDHPLGGHDDLANAAAGALVSLISPSQANAWIAYSANLAEHANEPPEQQDDDEQPEKFYLPRNPRLKMPALPDKDAAPHAKHFLTPIALRGNPVSEAYFSALGKFEGRSFGLHTPRCAFCGEATVGIRLSDGERAWCNAGCQTKWIAKRAERFRARELAENGGLPVKN